MEGWGIERGIPGVKFRNGDWQMRREGRGIKKVTKQAGGCFLSHFLVYKLLIYTAKEVPQPQLDEAFGLLKVNPRALSPCWKSISIPRR